MLGKTVSIKCLINIIKKIKVESNHLSVNFTLFSNYY